MNIENPFNNSIPPKKEAPKSEKVEELKSPKGIFLDSLERELAAMQESEKLSPEQAEEKRKAAAHIETGFSDDPAHDAVIFSRAGVADENELIDIFNKKEAK